MKTAEPLLYTVNVIWVVEDLLWLSCLLIFYLVAHTLKVDVRSCFLRAGQSLHKRVRFFPTGSSLTFSLNCFKLSYKDAVFMVVAKTEVVLLPSFVFASMLSMLMMYAVVQLCGGWCYGCCDCSRRNDLCSFGNASLHVWYAALSVWTSKVSFWSKVKWVAQTSRPASFLYTTASFSATY